MIRNKTCDICGREKQEVYDWDCKCGAIFYMCHYCYRNQNKLSAKDWQCKRCKNK